MMKKWFWGAAFTLTAGAAWAFGNDITWEAGGDQGVSEAIITSGAGNSIMATCDVGQDNNLTGITFEIGGTYPEDYVILTFDGQNPEQVGLWGEGMITSSCRACAGTYDWVIERLKRHHRIHVMTKEGKSTTFSLKGATKAIGDCTADFYR